MMTMMMMMTKMMMMTMTMMMMMMTMMMMTMMMTMTMMMKMTMTMTMMTMITMMMMTTMMMMITMMAGAMKIKEKELHVLPDIYSSVVCSTFLLITDNYTEMVTVKLSIPLAKWMGTLCNTQDREVLAYAIPLAK